MFSSLSRPARISLLQPHLLILILPKSHVTSLIVSPAQTPPRPCSSPPIIPLTPASYRTMLGVVFIGLYSWSSACLRLVPAALQASMSSNMIVLNNFPEIMGAREVVHQAQKEKGGDEVVCSWQLLPLSLKPRSQTGVHALARRYCKAAGAEGL